MKRWVTEWHSPLSVPNRPEFRNDYSHCEGPPLETTETTIVRTFHYGVAIDGVRFYGWATPNVFEYEAA